MAGVGTTGLRERRRVETTQEIGRAARRLFTERGFEAVTVADIAAAAGVGERTVYRYFPTKEHLALEHLAGFIAHGVALIEARPPDEHPLEAIRAALAELPAHGYEASLALDVVLVDTVASVAGLQHHLVVQAQDRLAAHFAERLGRPATDLDARLYAVVTTAAYQAAVRAWSAAVAAGDEVDDVWTLAAASVDRLGAGIDDQRRRR